LHRECMVGFRTREHDDVTCGDGRKVRMEEDGGAHRDVNASLIRPKKPPLSEGW
jgi:hypothetical protein